MSVSNGFFQGSTAVDEREIGRVSVSGCKRKAPGVVFLCDENEKPAGYIERGKNQLPRKLLGFLKVLPRTVKSMKSI